MERLPNRYPKISQSHKVPLYKGLSLFYPKLQKYLVVPNIFVLSSRADVTTFFNYFVRAREAWRATHSEQRTHRSFLCSFLYSIVCHAQSDISPVLSHKNIINIYGVNLAV